ncbi:hypothetical protein DF3PB_140014 [uncultured Defluviicoccus sp.]|uniref:Uncharacterized protein n=1 Tax=metagenome TaxID=256318 RepID=A0A380TB57_9ZZZZ|nr:hypothetical protein DF3PB_140014 [uncultured Defluviicoccus sp.]
MPHPFPVAFDDPPREDQVTLAVTPFDALTGHIVTRGVDVSVDGFSSPEGPWPAYYKTIRNRTGVLVLINLPPQPAYRVRVRAVNAGYFDQTFEFVPPAPDLSGRDRGREIARLGQVPLMRRPTFPFEPTATLVRGRLVRDGAAVQGYRVEAVPLPEVPDRVFSALSDERGNFALALRLPPIAGAEVLEPITVQFRFSEREDLPTLFELERDLADGRMHVFERPIDLAGTDRPDFADEGGSS